MGALLKRVRTLALLRELDKMVCKQMRRSEIQALEKGSLRLFSLPLGFLEEIFALPLPPSPPLLQPLVHQQSQL